MKKLLLKTGGIFRELRKTDLRGFRQIAGYYYQNFLERRKYRNWVARFDTLSDDDRRRIKTRIEELKFKPKISVLMPVYNTEEKWLRLAIESVLRQLYENWEFCIADDLSTKPHVRSVLEEYARKDARIKIVFRPENGHISAASNSALELATGEFAALLDHDDEFSEHALYFVAEEINNFPASDLIYSDEDLIGENGNRHTPKFKPDFSPDLMLSLNLVTHLSVYRTGILRNAGGFRKGFEGSQDYDLALRVIEQIAENHIRHIPQILYHWRSIKGSVALDIEEKPYAHERAREAIRGHFRRTNVKAKVVAAVNNLHRVCYELPADLPKVSLILSAGGDARNFTKSVENIFAKTDYQNFQLFVGASSREKNLENFEREIEVFKKDNRFKLIYLPPEKKNFSDELNEIAGSAGGEILAFLDGGVLPLDGDWLRELASFAMQPEIGAAGAKLLNENRTIKHGGIILGARDLFADAHENFPAEAVGNMMRTKIISNFSAVSGACLAIRREVFLEIKGFDSVNFPNRLYDVDLCLRLREKDYRIVFTPYAELIQARDTATEEIVSNWKKQKKSAPEIERFRQKWRHLFEKDPFYNRNLSLENANFLLASPPRFKKIWE